MHGVTLVGVEPDMTFEPSSRAGEDDLCPRVYGEIRSGLGPGPRAVPSSSPQEQKGAAVVVYLTAETARCGTWG